MRRHRPVSKKGVEEEGRQREVLTSTRCCWRRPPPPSLNSARGLRPGRIRWEKGPPLEEVNTLAQSGPGGSTQSCEGGGGGWGRPAQPYTRIYGDLKHRIPQGVPQPGAKYLGTWEQSRPSADAGQPPPQWAGRERKRQAGPQTHQRSQAQRWMVVNAGPVQDRLRDGACQTEY